MDKFGYHEILEIGLMNTIHMCDLVKKDVISQHDNDPKHTSKLILQTDC